MSYLEKMWTHFLVKQHGNTREMWGGTTNSHPMCNNGTWYGDRSEHRLLNCFFVCISTSLDKQSCGIC